ncbi:thioredoxin reductase (NADPH) [Tindallia magadiensis]|uniref:Thioredoxin reductase n=1 Tax=Tindallia magadiensis TaxID=69895 RepID=A0A1I3C0Y0_9FIRM|nr:thioredoxin-disulfide reductase [Tindallia magadiensis]SFH68083.1 thioredoxin reductase (NADPH) [Tindallia magadiensis]
MEKVYDVIIVGAGPAGLSAALYAGRAKLSTLVLEGTKVGGQIAITSEVDNYPGSMEDATGPSLTARMVEQAKRFGAEMVSDSVVSTDFKDKVKIVKGQKADYKGRSVIIATGANPRQIGCPGEKELTGKGVSYCATCDADFFEGLEIFVVGGGDTAVEEAIFLAKFARKVTIVHRRDELRAAKYLQEKVFEHPKIEIMWDSVIVDIKGDGLVESAVFHNRKTGETTEIKADEEDGTFGIFVLVGYEPVTEVFKGCIDTDESGYIIADSRMQTNVEGVFAAGDVRVKTLRQVVTATADGAIAAVEAEKYLGE